MSKFAVTITDSQYFSQLKLDARIWAARARLAITDGNAHYAGLYAVRAAHFGIKYLTDLGRWEESQPTLFVNERKTVTHATNATHPANR